MRQFRFFKGIKQPYELFETNTLTQHEQMLEQTVEDQETRIQTLQERIVELQDRIQEMSISPRHGSENRLYRDTQRVDGAMVEIMNSDPAFLDMLYKQQFQRLCEQVYTDSGFSMRQEFDSTTGGFTNTMMMNVGR